MNNDPRRCEVAKSKKKRRKNGRGGAAVWAAMCAAVALVLGLSAFAPAADSVGSGFDSSVTAASEIRLSEVMASNQSSLMLTDGTLPDWIELENTGDAAVSLDGYALMRDDDPTQIYRFSNVEIPAGGYLLVYADGGSDSGGELHAPFKIAAAGATIVLMDPSSAVIDSVATPELEADQVYCRGANGEWAVSIGATPGEANRITVDGEPGDGSGARITVVEDAVQVTEIMSASATFAPDENGEYHDYVEITNTGDSAVSLRGWYLSDSRDDLDRWRFPDVTLAAGEAIAVHCSGYDRADDPAHLHANFKLGSDGTDVVLTRSDGATVAAVEVPALNADQAYSLVDGEWTVNHAPTPGAANTHENGASAGGATLPSNTENVLISEIAAATTLVGSDWIEIYNAGSTAVDLSGYGLSDNAARPRKWRFPQGTVLEPGAYTAVFCSGLDTSAEGQVHSNFKLSADGGYSVTLSRPDGTIIDRVYVTQQYEDITFGRPASGSGSYYFTLNTPLARNDGEAFLGRAQQPGYSVEGGVFATGDVLTVELDVAEGTRVYYTLDSSDPSEASTPYTGPIEITGTTILRTRAYGDGYLESFVDTQSYLYDVNNGNGVYVVSLVSDPYNLTSEEAGIMIKGPNASDTYPYQGANYWQDWEREAHVEVFGGDGETVLSQGCGIKLHGQYSRAEAQQAFKVIARTRYGDNRFHAALFSNRDYTEYQSFLLRSSGQDTDRTRMRDSVLTSLAADTSVMYQETEICVLYLDGVYWGQYNLRERINTYSICQFEGWEGQEDDIDLVKANDNTFQGSNATFEALLDWIDTVNPASDEFYAGLDQVIDIRNYIEYMAIEIFTGNGDTLNVKRYRNANDDGKWRWVLFDLDWAFDVDTNSINRWLEPGGMGTNLYTDNSLFIACMQNPRFRDEFLTYMGEQMATTFTTEHVLSLIQARYEILEPLLADQFERWGPSMSEYQSQLQELIEYAQTRPTRLLQFFMGYGVEDSNIALTQEEMMHYFGDAIAIIQGNGQ